MPYLTLIILFLLSQSLYANPGASALDSKANGVAVILALLLESILIYTILAKKAMTRNFLFVAIFLVNIVTHFILFDLGSLVDVFPRKWEMVLGLEFLIVMIEALLWSFLLRCSGLSQEGKALPCLWVCIRLAFVANLLSFILYYPLRLMSDFIFWR